MRCTSTSHPFESQAMQNLSRISMQKARSAEPIFRGGFIMKFKREDYIAFLETEYDTQMKEYGRLIATKATVLKERGEVFVGKFVGFRGDFSIFKVRISDNMPRKILSGQHLVLSARWQVTRIGVIVLGQTFGNNINVITLMHIASGFQNQKTLHFAWLG